MAPTPTSAGEGRLGHVPSTRDANCPDDYDVASPQRSCGDGYNHLRQAFAEGATTRQGAEVYTDGSSVYDPLAAMGFKHARVIHSIGEHVRGSVSTNGVENYWSLLKRTYLGTYHSDGSGCDPET